MSADDNCQFILERINAPDRIVLDQQDHTYTCGRARDNEIVCLGLTVSRRHCIFFRSKNELYVTDLKTTKLHPNDIIGIGCPNVDTDNSMYVYELQTIKPPKVENNHTTTLSETIINIENICNDKSDVQRKRGQRNSNGDVPSKIFKLESGNCISDKNSLEDKCTIQNDNDIEIIHISGNDNLLNEKGNCDNFTKNMELDNKLNVKKHIDTNMMKSNNINMENINKNEISTASKNKKEELNINTFHEDQNHTENSLFHIKNIHDTVNNIVSKNTMENNKIKTNREENANNKEVNNFLIEVEISKTVDKTNQHFEQSNENKNLLLSANCVHNKDNVIKLENELQLTNTDENIYSPNTNIPLVSPIKLKQIQQEPKTKFSEDDVVNLSDSEDDIFPCSQLFDIGYGMNTSIKDEIKEEPAEIENVRYSIVDDADLIISLTDSEDEDNNWLHKLSRSQILNENDEIDINDIKKEDIELKTDIDIEEPFRNEFEFIDNRKNIDEQIEAKKSIDKEEENIQGIKNLNEIISPKTFVSVKNLNKIISQETVSNKPKNFEDYIEKLTLEGQSSKYQNLSPTQKKIENYMDIANRTNRIESTVSSRKKKLIEKKVPQIEPPHLPTRKRNTNTNKVKQSPQKHEKSTKKKLSANEKKKREEMLKIEQRLYAKEQKNRKMLHKWADCLPPSKQKKINILSKEEKKVLIDNRKMKLKKLAIEEKRLSLENNQEKKRIVSKPKAKITTKTRNDFLVEDTISASRLENVTEKSKASSSQSTVSNTSNSEMTNSIKHKNISKEITKHLQYKLMLNDISNLGKIPKKSNTTKIKINTAEAETALKELSLEKKIEKTNELKNIESQNKSNKESSKLIENKSSVSKSNIKSNFVKPKKRVSFSAVIQNVREYQIDESNVLKKLTGKDAPIPAEKVIKKPSNITESNAKKDQFLWRILCWKPVWLEEQQYLNQDPPVIQPEELNVTLTHYRSYEEYYNIISPLLLLEIWHGITKQFQSIDHIYRRPTFMCSIVENSIQTNVSNNIFFTTLMLEVLATKEDIRKQIHPIFGDLIFFEYVQNHEKSQKSKDFRKVFAYVTNTYSTVLTPVTRFNQDLKNYVKNPHTLLTYTVTTKCLDKNILVNRVQRLRAVIYLRSSLRMIQALQFLPNSPLVNLILNPQFEMYKLPVVSELETLITGDKLNQKQIEAVNRVTKAVVHKDTKLCFIQGPPGTGKSKVIVNIITQILYGNNRYTSNGSSFKMLVCAPSNTAIDEIVLRLLNVRTTIKQQAKMKPFKMVRIGQLEMMHPKVKDISVTELAKRDIRKTNNANNTPSDSIENEKLLLQSKMNALRCKLNSRNLDETHKQNIKMKLNDMTMKYELLKNRESLNELNIRNKEYMKLQRITENKFLEYADIITCTLSSCYTSQMESIFGINNKKISVCIVDEATQSCEAETLIPLMLGINILILVGDPNQLPATVLSTQAKKYGLDQSIFSRVQNAFELQPNNPIIMLDTQYRMQHDISSWPNKFFYGGKLKTAVERDDTFPFYPYRILNLNSNQNDNNSNNEEADFVANIVYCMLTSANLDNWESCISCGILTPYNNQKSMILTKIHEKIFSLPENIKKKVKIDVNTVDGFQGQECDIIIMSCVRSQKIGFLSDRQRLCVALTRAKRSLIMCGNFNIFMRYPMWNSLISDAKSRKVFFNVDTNADLDKVKSYVIKRTRRK
ncbi:helicase sen1 isoform X2 [Apis mellifera]|uniref:Helicase sen1 isoform X2 n=1 Tax=Apis mellifera TaxID=7460 RepID=A0A7M7M4T6_APIME|nr:helicase sen1 isoform X2 [Apis mellifera]|eukprot:XP_016769194.1 helicase sen1 isoform X2 [Apis mellifera]